ncbi:hypothetical protein ACSQ67_024372 [Phaseolus vulgaris]
METICTLFIHMLLNYKPEMSLCSYRNFPTPFLWLPLLLILLSNASANGVKQKAINLFSSFILYLLFKLCLFSSHLEAKESMVYSYTKSFNAFAASLSEDEAKNLSGM